MSPCAFQRVVVAIEGDTNSTAKDLNITINHPLTTMPVPGSLIGLNHYENSVLSAATVAEYDPTHP